MTQHHKIIALDLKNAKVENLNQWFLTNNFITANATKDNISYRILKQNEDNPIRYIFIINDCIFGTVHENDFRSIDIPYYLQEEFVEQCIPIQIQEVELYRSVIIDWIFNNHRTKPKTGAGLSAFQKFKDDCQDMRHPHFTSCITCIDVLELGFVLGDFHSIFDDKFKAIHQHFRMNYGDGGYFKRVKLSRIYIIDQYIMGYTFNMEGQTDHFYFYNLNFENMLFDYIKPFTFDQDIELTLDDVLDKINLVGLDQLTDLEKKILTENK
jgi:hypothetical protein